MNPFDCISDMEQTLRNEVRDKGIKSDDTITMREHYNRMLNMLGILKEQLEDAEYNYQVSGVNYSDIMTFGELTVMKKELNDEVIIFQPIAVGEAELSAVDMQSLSEVLTKLRDDGIIKQNMLLLPPNINIFKAVLKKPDNEEF